MMIDMHSITRKILLLTHIHRYACIHIDDMAWIERIYNTIHKQISICSMSSLVSSFQTCWLVPSDKGCRTVMNNASVMVCFLSEDGSILNIRKLIHIMVNPYLMKLWTTSLRNMLSNFLEKLSDFQKKNCLFLKAVQITILFIIN